MTAGPFQTAIIKVFACCQYGHATIEANLKLAQQADPNEIESIHLVTHVKARIMDNPDPDTTISGKFSMQHIVATSALEPLRWVSKRFRPICYMTRKVAALRHKVTMSAYDPCA